jgi:hypothetical protein
MPEVPVFMVDYDVIEDGGSEPKGHHTRPVRARTHEDAWKVICAIHDTGPRATNVLYLHWIRQFTDLERPR